MVQVNALASQGQGWNFLRNGDRLEKTGSRRDAYMDNDNRRKQANQLKWKEIHQSSDTPPNTFPFT